MQSGFACFRKHRRHHTLKVSQLTTEVAASETYADRMHGFPPSAVGFITSPADHLELGTKFGEADLGAPKTWFKSAEHLVSVSASRLGPIITSPAGHNKPGTKLVGKTQAAEDVCLVARTRGSSLCLQTRSQSSLTELKVSSI